MLAHAWCAPAPSRCTHHHPIAARTTALTLVCTVMHALPAGGQGSDECVGQAALFKCRPAPMIWCCSARCSPELVKLVCQCEETRAQPGAGSVSERVSEDSGSHACPHQSPPAHQRCARLLVPAARRCGVETAVEGLSRVGGRMSVWVVRAARGAQWQALCVTHQELGLAHALRQHRLNDAVPRARRRGFGWHLAGECKVVAASCSCCRCCSCCGAAPAAVVPTRGSWPQQQPTSCAWVRVGRVRVCAVLRAALGCKGLGAASLGWCGLWVGRLPVKRLTAGRSHSLPPAAVSSPHPL